MGLRRSAYVIAVIAALTTSLTAGVARAATSVFTTPSRPPAEVAVVPIAPPAVPNDTLVFAGATGFLHHYNGSSEFTWTRYADGVSSAVPDLAGVPDSLVVPAGGDLVSTRVQLFTRPAPGKYTVINLADGALYQWAPPTGFAVRVVYGTSTLLVSGAENGVSVLRLVSFASDGTSTSRLVTGVPADAAFLSLSTASNGTYGTVVYQTSDGSHRALVSAVTGAFTPIPGGASSLGGVLLGATSVAVYPNTRPITVHTYSISGLVSGSNTTSRDVAVPNDAAYHIELAGDDHLVLTPTTGTGKALDLPIAGGGATSDLLATVAGNALSGVHTPDGAVLVVGGSTAADRAVHRFTAGSGAGLADHVVLTLVPNLHNAGLSLGHGVLRHIVTGDNPTLDSRFFLQNHALQADSTTIPGLQDDGGVLDPSAVTCATGVACVYTADGSGQWMVYLTNPPNGTLTLRATIDAYWTSESTPLPSHGGRLVDVSPGFAVVNGTDPATQYVVRLGYSGVFRTGPVTAAALWYNTLWTTGATPGQLVKVELLNDQQSVTVSTGVDCAPTELQATGRWVYWSCGASGPRGVYDSAAGGSVPLPAITGPALLGDGYLAWHDSAAGALNMVDFHNVKGVADQTGIPTRPTGRPVVSPVVKLASLPAGPVPDDRNITWTLDKFGGPVAYVGANGAVHVLDTGVPPSPVAIGTSQIQNLVYPRSTTKGYFTAFNASVEVSRPVTQWSLTVTRDLTGATVYTAAGGAERDSVVTSWDGTTAGGGYAVSGRYSWRLSVLPVGSSTWQQLTTGRLAVNCGVAPFRSYGCMGDAALLAVGNVNGYIWQGGWYEAQPGGTLRDNGYTETWPLGTFSGGYTAIVPFGDDNGDGLPDLLARDSAGVLRLYEGIGQADFDPGTRVSVVIGTGWNGYTLAYAGDVNKDGLPDLLARDSAGSLWLYPGSGTASVRPRVLIGTGWNTYARLVGAGDLNGDGVGDLLGVDAAGSLWRYQGNGTGGFGARTLVGTGWGGYNTLIGAGDINFDGHNDLVARDGSGNLWLYPGDGTGGFGGRILLGTGFQQYQALF